MRLGELLEHDHLVLGARLGQPPAAQVERIERRARRPDGIETMRPVIGSGSSAIGIITSSTTRV